MSFCFYFFIKVKQNKRKIDHFRNEEDQLVDQLSNVMHDLGISRFDFAKEIPAEYESLETMLDTLGKRKRHSLARAS